jgi:hypothetical protein
MKFVQVNETDLLDSITIEVLIKTAPHHLSIEKQVSFYNKNVNININIFVVIYIKVYKYKCSDNLRKLN